MSRVNDKVSRGLEVPLRAFCCKARGGGGPLRHATEIVKKEKKQEKEVIYLDIYPVSEHFDSEGSGGIGSFKSGIGRLVADLMLRLLEVTIKRGGKGNGI